MDSTRDLCEIKNSFNYSPHSFKEIPEFIQTDISSPRAHRNKFFKKNDKNKVLKIENHTKLAVDLADPYQKIKDEYFQERSSLVLANIDLVFNFSDQDRGYIVLQYMNELDYVVLDGDVGFLKYLQFRLPKSRAFTNCSVIKNKKIEKTNLNVNCENGLSNFVKKLVPEGVSLVFSNSLNYKENLLNAIKILKPGGTFISKFYEDTDLDFLFITSLCFDSFVVFKPFLENLNEKFSYVIAKKYKGNSIDVINQIENFKGIIIHQPFMEYIENYYKSLSELKKSLKEQQYNMYRCKAIMNII